MMIDSKYSTKAGPVTEPSQWNGVYDQTHISGFH